MDNAVNDIYNKYLDAYRQFRKELFEKPAYPVNLNLHRAARILSDTPLSSNFFDTVKGVEQGRIHPDMAEADRRHFLADHASGALVDACNWHIPNP